MFADNAHAPVVELHDIYKSYRFHEQSPGLSGAVRSMIHRTYRTHTAVEDLSLRIRLGEIVGLLGSNGAGKTTTLKMLSGLLRPTSGEISVLGATPSDRKRDFLRRIAMVMGQKSMLWWDVPAMDSFLVHKEIYSIGQLDFEASISELSEMLQIERILNKPVRKLSLGERMKCELALALLHNPELLFLDEPTIGLDVVSKLAVREFLLDLNRRRGTTVVITSHDMDDIESLCPRIAVMANGRLRFDGELGRFVESVAPGKTVLVTYRDEVRLSAAHLPPGIEMECGGDAHQLLFHAASEQVGEVVALVSTLGAIADIDIRDPDIDMVMRTFFSGTRESQ